MGASVNKIMGEGSDTVGHAADTATQIAGSMTTTAAKAAKGDQVSASDFGF